MSDIKFKCYRKFAEDCDFAFRAIILVTHEFIADDRGDLFVRDGSDGVQLFATQSGIVYG